MARNIVASLILPLTSFIVFVDSPHPFSVVVTFFIGYCTVTGGRFSHPVGQIMTLISLLVCGRPISTSTRLVSFPLGIFILPLFSIVIRALSGCLVRKSCSPSGCFYPYFFIRDVSASYCCWFFHPLLLYHPLWCCCLNWRLLYHWVSCSLGCQYDPDSHKV